MRLERLGQMKNPMTSGDGISLILFFQNKDSRLKNCVLIKTSCFQPGNKRYLRSCVLNTRKTENNKDSVRVTNFFTAILMVRVLNSMKISSLSYFTEKVKCCSVIKIQRVPWVGGHTLRE
jgi:hypothetical protein